MERNIELIKFIYRNAEMGLSTLTQINQIAEEQSFRALLQEHLLWYKSVSRQAELMLEERGEKPEPPQMGKLGAGAMICAKTLTDKSEAHLAEMLILGSTRGVIDVTHKLREYKDCDDAIKNLGFKLLWTEQTNIDELKKFL